MKRTTRLRLAALSGLVGVLALLVTAALREGRWLDWQQAQALVRVDGAPAPVMLRQIG